MAEPLSLSLRAWPTKDPTSDALPNLIPRINEQRGAFRNVTEEGLEQEIRASEAGEVPAEPRENGAQPFAVQDAKGKREEILATREEILKQVAQAQMETLYALDFVSLLLSKETPRQAEISMSPHLKQTVPMGSLGLDITRLPQPSESEKREAGLVSQGWKLEGLTSAANSLLRSATRLEKEIEQETRYWEQVLAVKKEGWSICRLPRERHTLGVRYGFAEAAPEFRDRGLAALRRGVDGSIVLDQGITVSDPKLVRVRVKDKGALVSESSLPHVSADTDIAIEQLIHRARNNIFEEELFHEISREARTLASQGVHSIENVIHMQSSDDREVLLDVVPLSDETSQPRNSIRGPDHLAESIALSLRILLSYAHRQNLRRRSQLPPPLTERKPPRSIYAILRPILTYLQHQSALTALRRFLSSIVEPLRAAGLTCEFVVDTLSSLNLSTVTDANANPGKSTVDVLIETLTRPLVSSATITLPTSTNLALEIRTHLYPPTFGTEYLVTNSAFSSHSNHSEPPTITFASKTDFEEHILHLLTLDTVATINTFPSLTDADDAKSASAPWLVTDAHSGELTKTFGSLGRSKRMVVAVDRDKLEVRWGWMNGKPEAGRYAWDSAMNGKEGGRKMLREVVDEAGKYRNKKGESAV